MNIKYTTKFLFRVLTMVAIFSATSVSQLTAGVNPDGSFSHGIAIEIPPGTAGMQPSVSLGYNSNGGNGIVGKGWSVSGFATISRVDNGYGITGQPSDRYAGPGGLLVDITETGTGTEYHTENESYTKYEPVLDGNGQPQSWVVTQPDGTKLYFGSNDNSKLEYAPTGNSTNGVYRVWALERVLDLNGNYYEITYQKINGILLPHKVLYTQNAAQSLSRFRAVVFVYNDNSIYSGDNTVEYPRSDTYQMRAQNTLVQMQHYLKEIEVRYDVEANCWTEIFCNDGKLVRSYELDYEESPVSREKRLKSVTQFGVTETGAKGDSLPPQVFTYDDRHNRLVVNANGDATLSEVTSSTPAATIADLDNVAAFNKTELESQNFSVSGLRSIANTGGAVNMKFCHVQCFNNDIIHDVGIKHYQLQYSPERKTGTMVNQNDSTDVFRIFIYDDFFLDENNDLYYVRVNIKKECTFDPVTNTSNYAHCENWGDSGESTFHNRNAPRLVAENFNIKTFAATFVGPNHFTIGFTSHAGRFYVMEKWHVDNSATAKFQENNRAVFISNNVSKFKMASGGAGCTACWGEELSPNQRVNYYLTDDHRLVRFYMTSSYVYKYMTAHSNVKSFTYNGNNTLAYITNGNALHTKVYRSGGNSHWKNWSTLDGVKIRDVRIGKHNPASHYTQVYYVIDENSVLHKLTYTSPFGMAEGSSYTKETIAQDIVQMEFTLKASRLGILDKNNDLWVKTDSGSLLHVSSNVKSYYTSFSFNVSQQKYADCFITYDDPENSKCHGYSNTARTSSSATPHRRTNLTGLEKTVLFAISYDRSLYLYLNGDTMNINGTNTGWAKIAEDVSSYSIDGSHFGILYGDGKLYVSALYKFEDYVKNLIATNGNVADINDSLTLAASNTRSFYFTGNKIGIVDYKNDMTISNFYIDKMPTSGSYVHFNTPSIQKNSVRSFQMLGSNVAVHKFNTELDMYNIFNGVLQKNFSNVRSFTLSFNRLGYTDFTNNFWFVDFKNIDQPVLANQNMISCRSGDYEIYCLDYNYNLYRHRTGTLNDPGTLMMFNNGSSDEFGWYKIASNVRQYSTSPVKFTVLSLDNTLQEINKSDLGVSSQTGNVAYFQYNSNYKGLGKLALPSGTLAFITNSIGGTMDIAYHHSFNVPGSADESDVGYPYSFDSTPKILVRLIKVTDGRGGLNILTTKYSFFNAKVYIGTKPGESKPLGFESMEVTTPDQIKTVSNFSQNILFSGKLLTSSTYSADGDLIKKIDYEWLSELELENQYSVTMFTPTSKLVLPKKQIETLYESGVVASKIQTENITFDVFGNITKQQIQIGYGGTPEEVKTTYYTHLNDSVKWVLGVVDLEQTLDETATLLAKTKYVYDANYQLIETGKFLIEENRFIYNGIEYDTYGNIVKTGILWKAQNQLIRSTGYEYDPVYATYPIRTYNQIGHSVISDIDYATGKPLCTSDLFDANVTIPNCTNHNPILYQYDQFKREVVVIDTTVEADTVTNDQAVQNAPWIKHTVYNDAGGDPNAQSITVRTRDDSAVNGYLWSRTHFDGLGRTYKTVSNGITSNNNVVKNITYNNAGQVNKESSQKIIGITDDAWTNYEYDSVGRLVKTIYPDGNASYKVYGKNYTRTVDAKQNSAINYFDYLGRVIEIRENGSVTPGTNGNWIQDVSHRSKVYYEYDTLGRIVKTTDADGNITNITFDSLGRKSTMSISGLGQWTYTYGWITPEVVSITDPKNITSVYKYDDLGRITVKKDETDAWREVYWYDEAPVDSSIQSNYLGKLTKTQDDASVTNYYYNTRGKINHQVSTIGQTDYTFQYAYDISGRLEEMQYPDGKIVKNIYAKNGALRQVRLLQTPGSSGSPIVTYEGPGTTGENSIIRYTGSRTHKTNVETAITFDTLNMRPTAAKTTLPQVVDAQGAIIQEQRVQRDVAYTYDQVGNITQIQDIVDNTRTQTFTYDEANRLVGANGNYGNLNYTYSNGGDLKTKGNTVNYYNGSTHCDTPAPNHAVCADSKGNKYRYDANGNMIFRGGRELVYDFSDRLTEIKDESGAVTETYTYNHTGQRVIKERADGTTVYNVGGLYEVSIDSSGNELHTKYIYGASGDLAAQETLNTTDVTLAGINRYSKYAMASLAAPGSATWFKRIVSEHFRGRQTDANVYLFILVVLLLMGLYIKSNWKAYRKTSANERRKMAPMALFTAIVFIFTFVFNGCEGVDTYTDESLVAPIDLTGADDISLMPSSMYNDATTNGQVRVGILFFHPNFQGSTALVTDYSGVLVTEINYKPYGEIDRTASSGYDVSRYKYTGQEEDPETSLVYYGARYYDPAIGRFITHDSKFDTGARTQGFNRYMYTAGNPVMYTDPNGHFLLFLLLFTTEQGYNLQQALLPVAIKIDLHYGSEQKGIGINVSVGLPTMLPISYRHHWGRTWYTDNYVDFEGTETREGGKWTVLHVFSYSYTTYSREDETDQTVYQVSVKGSRGRGITMSNDYPLLGVWPGFPEWTEEDGYRTGAGEIDFGPVSIGVNIYTGSRLDTDRPEINGNETYVHNEKKGKRDPDKYRAGVLYVKIGIFRVGINSEKVRNYIQNEVIHENITDDPYFKELDTEPTFYYYVGTGTGDGQW